MDEVEYWMKGGILCVRNGEGLLKERKTARSKRRKVL